MNFDALPGEEKWLFAPVAGPPVVGVRRSRLIIQHKGYFGQEKPFCAAPLFALEKSVLR
jgi:hypothetical protein